MASEQQLVTWSEDQSTVVTTVDELELVLDQLVLDYCPEQPIIITIDGPKGESIYSGIGAQSFVSSCEPPYLTTVGDNLADGEVEFFFHGHHSPITYRNLIQLEVSKKIVKEFFISGQLPFWQVWEPIGLAVT